MSENSDSINAVLRRSAAASERISDFGRAAQEVEAAHASGDALRIKHAEQVMDEADRQRRMAAKPPPPDFGAGAGTRQGYEAPPADMNRKLRADALGIDVQHLP